MKISIIIPLYNKAPYVCRTLSSVLAQTFTDYEVIIIDDGSTDESIAVVETWLKGNINKNYSPVDGHWRLIFQKNAGVSAARNFGVSKSKGDYICFLDADDWWAPTFLEEMLTLAERYPDAGLYASNYIYYKPGKTRVGVTNVAYTEAPYINYLLSYCQGTGMPVTSISVMMRRHVFDTCGGFPEGIRLGEDFIFWAKIALLYPIAFLDKPLAYYNNDVPASFRATRNLHAPEHHMLWHLQDIENMLNKDGVLHKNDWKRLISKLRANGLLEYWMDKRYHNEAAAELAKIDWSLLPASARRLYLLPVWFVRFRRFLLHLGSFCKQFLLLRS